MTTLADRLQEIRAQLPVDRHVTIIAVSKYTTPEKILEAYHAGIRDFGENRIQDFEAKCQALPPQVADDAIRWHLLGHLQSNKVKRTLGRFSLIHSLDSLALAQRLSRLNEEQGQVQPVLLQLNWMRESQKTGFLEEELRRDYPSLIRLSGLSVQGLMAIGPNPPEAVASRACFKAVSQFRDELVGTYGHALPELSMGMSQDFQHAIECGATIIRLGNRLFGS